MTDMISEKTVQMTADDYRAAANEAREAAVAFLMQDATFNRSGDLVRAADLLRASDTLHARANLLDLCELDNAVDSATVDVLEPEPA